MSSLPPLECLRFFEAAARHESFSRAASELFITPAAVAQRVKMLERYLGGPLFTRHPKGVRLSPRGTLYLQDVQGVLRKIREATERCRGGARVLRIVTTEVVAAHWLLPRLTDFNRDFPNIPIELEIDAGTVSQRRRDFDLWIAPSDKVEGNLDAERLFRDTLLPVCSPALLETREHPRKPDDLRAWPLLYHLDRETYWRYWFRQLGVPTTDLRPAFGFRHHRLMVEAAIGGMGVALAYAEMNRRALVDGVLTPMLEASVAAPHEYTLVTRAETSGRVEVRAFRDHMLREVGKLNEDQ